MPYWLRLKKALLAKKGKSQKEEKQIYKISNKL
jgi:hypothetical protein